MVLRLRCWALVQLLLLIVSVVHGDPPPPPRPKPDKIFEECDQPGLRCFTIVPGKLTKTKKSTDFGTIPGKTQFGVYIRYIDDENWKIDVASDPNWKTLVTLTIGENTYNLGQTTKDQPVTVGNVVVKLADEYDSAGVKYRLFDLKATEASADKDLMTAFGFYEGKTNQIKLKFETTVTEIDAKEVANFPNYKRNDYFNFFATSAGSFLTPTDDNMFTCDGENHIFLNNAHIKTNEIRYTAKGWLSRTGTKLAEIKGDKEDLVFCYSLCRSDPNDLLMKITGGGLVKPTQQNPPEMTFTCQDSEVKVAGKFYDAVNCANNEWKADGELIDLETKDLATLYTFKAECFGAFKFAVKCTPKEKTAGCDDVNINAGEISCAAGHALTLRSPDGTAKTTDPIYNTLKVVKGLWNDGTNRHANVETDRPYCKSKCSDEYVIREKPDNTEKAQYNPNTKTLTCSEGTDVLVATLDGSEKPYIGAVTCDWTDGWKENGVVKKDLKTVKTEGELTVKAYCYKACGSHRIKDQCAAGGPDCEPSSSFPKTISCPSSSVLYVNAEPRDNELKCKKEGWAKEGDPTLVIDHTMLTNYKDEITVTCFKKCGTKFRSSPGLKETSNVFSCPGTEMIKYKFGDTPEKKTLDDLTCDDTVGWKDGTTSLTPFPTGKSIKLTADCEPSCTDGVIDPACGKYTNCEKPTLDADVLACKDPGKVLLAKGTTVEMGTIQCKKKSFENADASIKIDRKDAAFKAKVTCVSKCHKEFIKTASTAVDAPGQANSLTRPKDGDATYNFECQDPLHYTTLEFGGDKAYSEKAFTCDPVNGWSAPDHNDGAVFATFNGQEVKAGCLFACEKRVDKAKVCTGIPGCEMPKLTGSALKCADTHIMRRIDKSTKEHDYLRTQLTCTLEGYKLGDTVLLPFEVSNPTKKFDVGCIPNCHVKFVEMQGLTRSAENEKLKCGDEQILVLDIGAENKRVFEEMTCKADKGWTTGTAALPTVVVDFTQNVQFKASCQKVCEHANIDVLCEKDKTPCTDSSDHFPEHTKTGNVFQVKCKAHHLLFLNGVEVKHQDGQCTKFGWKAKGTPPADPHLIDFTKEAVDITKQTSAICKHKCNVDFIDFSLDSCAPDTNCSKANYKDNKLSCEDETEVLVIKHGGTPKDAFIAVCNNDGWNREEVVMKPDGKPDTNPDGSLKTKLTNLFKLDKVDYHVKAWCEQLCTLATSSIDADKMANRVFDRTAATHLTCNDVNEMLTHDDKGVYSDMNCTRKGWKATDGNFEVKFDLDAPKPRAQQFKCDKSDCMRPMACDTKNPCTNPDFLSKKYHMSCVKPARIIDASKNVAAGSDPENIEDMQCVNGEWMEGPTSRHKVGDTPGQLEKAVADRDKFSFTCFSKECAMCKDTMKKIECAPKDKNCVQPSITSGRAGFCTQYTCESSHFVIKDGVNKYFFNDPQEMLKPNTIKCTGQKNGQDEFAYNDREHIGDVAGCVNQIPCNVHSKLDSDCSGLKVVCATKMAEKLAAGTKYNEKLAKSTEYATEPVKCDEPEQIYYMTAANTWSIVDSLQCNKKGEWDATVQSDPSDPTKTEKITLPREGAAPRVVCAPSDPSVRPPTTTKAPPNPKTQTCEYCETIPYLNCEDCKNDILRENDLNWKCVGKAKSGRIVYNNNQETTDPITCQKNNATGKYEWLAGGKVVTAAAVTVKLADKLDIGMIIGVSIAVVVILGGSIGAFFFLRIRKKRELARLEALQSKGLEQKMDSILEGVSVEDPKTVKL